MLRIKSRSAVLILAAILGVAPGAYAQTVKIVIAGSPTMWQAMALAAYESGECIKGGVKPCSHYTHSGDFKLVDSRAGVTDTGSIWIVWDSAPTPNVWVYVKQDSLAGVRCYFANPACNVSVTSFPPAGNLISGALWGDGSNDVAPPLAVQGLFLGGTLVNAAATELRPEDALFTQCRTNSRLGGGPDGLAGLGYGSNPPGICAVFGDEGLIGAPIMSGYPGSSAQANDVAFSIGGRDPFTNLPLPKFTTVTVGAVPIIFIVQRSGALATVSNATDMQLQMVFGGVNCDASAFGAPAGAIQAFLREPVSGTMVTAEETVFRYPSVLGLSEERGVNAINPLKGLPCALGGNRSRAIGTGEEVQSVLNVGTNFDTDGIGYAFFSYRNVAPLADSANYGYLTLNGADPIFQVYGAGNRIDRGQPASPGTLPGSRDLPCGDFPCPERAIWGGGLSFPNLRAGSYRSWAVLRLVSYGNPLAEGQLLATHSLTYVVNSEPDYVPFFAVGTDPGLKLWRSHYGEEGAVNTGSGEKGRDSGGCIIQLGSVLTGVVEYYPPGCS